MMGPAPIKVSLAEWECRSTKTKVCYAINAVQRHNKTPEMLHGRYMGPYSRNTGPSPISRVAFLKPSPAHECGEGRELVGDEAARRRIGQFAGRGVNFRVDQGDDDLGFIEDAPVEVDEDMAQMQLRSYAPEQAWRSALE